MPQIVKAKFDLEDRTAKFVERVISFIQGIKLTPLNTPLLNQLIRSATSIGANYMEANGAESKKDFCHKIGICKKEAKETSHWLRMLHRLHDSENTELLMQEAKELTLIFSKILISAKSKK